ncbi:hypothetical protein C8J36_103538 [Rhizobium sp. PP-F2F-G48]|uniref:hypothetical protein n=1 Tax=Rhizobium sp. PP-F2F-G48 TaxID=2135651 RepID=UPI0010518461|nr:hypothetical protein [Rhizobium sp. PP-F2F-G48]TCM56168.1 hypothetical protein C8J36_103538 [Rhizobium sp. PP-F2F-G48]
MKMARFAIIPGWIVTDTRLKGRDLQVLCLLGRHTDKHGWCRRSQVKMAGQLECARSTVQASLDRLSVMGVVEKHLEPSKDGRDSAHWYRVIFDQKVAEQDFEEWESEEFDPILGAVEGTPPAGISAPPADPESAPPADPASAPINDPYLTTPDQLGERARARDLRDEEENPRSIERRFKKWWHAWPGYLDDSEMNAVRCWQALTPEQRKACEDLTPVYLAARDKMGRTKAKAASTYLTERQWERLAHADVAEVVKPTNAMAAPFGKLWMATRLAELLLGPSVNIPGPTSFEQAQIREGKLSIDDVRSEKRKRFGWPSVNEMQGRALEKPAAKGWLCPIALKEATGDFRQIQRTDTVQLGAWNDECERRGWPPLMLSGQHEWIWFPPVHEGETPAVAIARFADAISNYLTTRRQGDEHAA